MKKGDIVGRKSYGKDVIFLIDRIIKMSNGEQIALLKGLTIRIEADALVQDLEVISKEEIKNIEKEQKNILDFRIKEYLKNHINKRESIIYTGKILHLDGDKRYSEKSKIYYKKMGLNAIVKNVDEKKQPTMISDFLSIYNPDILVITGHDRNDKKGKRL